MHHVPRNPLTKCYVLHIRAAWGCAHVILELSVLSRLSFSFVGYLRIESISELSSNLHQTYGPNHAFPDSVQCTIANVGKVGKVGGSRENTKAGFTMQILRHGSRDRSSDPQGKFGSKRSPRWTLSRAGILLLCGTLGSHVSLSEGGATATLPSVSWCWRSWMESTDSSLLSTGRKDHEVVE